MKAVSDPYEVIKEVFPGKTFVIQAVGGAVQIYKPAGMSYVDIFGLLKAAEVVAEIEFIKEGQQSRSALPS